MWASSATTVAREAALNWESWDFQKVSAQATGVRFAWDSNYDGIRFPADEDRGADRRRAGAGALLAYVDARPLRERPLVRGSPLARPRPRRRGRDAARPAHARTCGEPGQLARAADRGEGARRRPARGRRVRRSRSTRGTSETCFACPAAFSACAALSARVSAIACGAMRPTRHRQCSQGRSRGIPVPSWRYLQLDGRSLPVWRSARSRPERARAARGPGERQLRGVHGSLRDRRPGHPLGGEPVRRGARTGVVVPAARRLRLRRAAAERRGPTARLVRDSHEGRLLPALRGCDGRDAAPARDPRPGRRGLHERDLRGR